MKRVIHCFDLVLVFLPFFAICFPFSWHCCFLLYGLDLEDDLPFRCISSHPDFETICLRREVLETAIDDLSQARGI